MALPMRRARQSKLKRWPALTVNLKKSPCSTATEPLTAQGTGTTCAVLLLRLVAALAIEGRSSTQATRRLDAPLVVATRNGYQPIGVSAATSMRTLNLAG